MGSTSYWQAELASARPVAPGQWGPQPLQGAHRSEVVIVGAGITGTALALLLARSGVQVRVLEGRWVAAGASGRNAGIITSTTGEKYATLVARYGREYARRLWSFHVNNAALAADILAELAEMGWDCAHRHQGLIGLAASESEFDELTASAALLNADGWRAQPLSRQDLPASVQAAYYGGIFHPQSGELQPARFVAGLAWLAQQAGAIFHERSPVDSLAEGADGLAITTPRGRVQAHRLVLATNAWLPELAALLGVRGLMGCLRPTRGQVLATEPIAARLFPCPCSADAGYQYWRQLSDGRLVVGGWRNTSFATEASSDETPGVEVQRHLDAFVQETLGLSGVHVVARWAGVMAFTPDGLPLIGRLPGTQNCYLAGGYSGHGNASALEAARIVCAQLLGHDHPEGDMFDPARFFA